MVAAGLAVVIVGVVAFVNMEKSDIPVLSVGAPMLVSMVGDQDAPYVVESMFVHMES